jgi:hypothetical protein
MPQSKKSVAVHAVVTFEHGPDFVRARFPHFMLVDGILFTSPEMILDFAVRLIEEAKEVWPDNPIVKEYMGGE